MKDRSCHALVKAADELNEDVGTSKLAKDIPECYTGDRVKSFFQIKEDHEHGLMLFSCFLK